MINSSFVLPLTFGLLGDFNGDGISEYFFMHRANAWWCDPLDWLCPPPPNVSSVSIIDLNPNVLNQINTKSYVNFGSENTNFFNFYDKNIVQDL